MLSNVFYLLAFPREIQFFYCPSHTDGQFSVSVNDAWPKLIFPPQKYAKHEHFKKIKREDHDLSAKYVRKQIVLSNIYAH